MSVSMPETRGAVDLVSAEFFMGSKNRNTGDEDACFPKERMLGHLNNKGLWMVGVRHLSRIYSTEGEAFFQGFF
jgi:hypothetical protein